MLQKHIEVDLNQIAEETDVVLLTQVSNSRVQACVAALDRAAAAALTVLGKAVQPPSCDALSLPLLSRHSAHLLLSRRFSCTASRQAADAMPCSAQTQLLPRLTSSTPHSTPPLVLPTQALDDHTHMPTLRALPKGLTVVACPEAAARIAPLGFRRVVTVDHGQSTSVCDGRLIVTATKGGARPRPQQLR